jgi:fengycin family lipopeptide synthetase D
MPLTLNGKIDRKALPEPDESAITATEYEAPRNIVEEKLAEIWQQVLKIKKVGIDDNLFQIGGHSLKAIVISSKISKEFNKELSVSEIFRMPTIKELADYIGKAEKKEFISIEPVEKRKYYPASSAEKRMFILNQMEGSGIGYNIPMAMKIEGKINKIRLEDTIKALVKRHENLRTSFKLIDEEPVQIINDEDTEIKIMYAKAKDDEVNEIIKEFVRPFDLSETSLMRVGLIEIKEDEHVLLIDVHHIVLDGISSSILLREFGQLYEGKELPDLQLQYKDFAVWQNKLFETEAIKKQEDYWLNIFSGELPVLSLSTDYVRQAIRSFEGDNIRFSLGEDLTKELRKIAKETGCTMYMLLLAGINILLSKYSGQEDIIIGSPTAGRTHADLDRIIGMFVNTLAMRSYPVGEKTYKRFLMEVKETALSAFENQDYQFEELVNRLNLHRDMSRNALFDVMFVMQNIEKSNIEVKDLVIKKYKQEYKVSKFDLSFGAGEVGDEIVFTLEYSTKLFKRETIKRMTEHLKNIFKEVSENINIKLNEIEMLTKEEEDKILNQFSGTYIKYPKEKTINQLFEEQVERTPDNIAVVFQQDKVTYRELNDRVNILAIRLRESGVKPDSIVGLMVDRSLEMIVGIMGILKAGGAYLPIDVSFPDDEVLTKHENNNLQHVNTQNDLAYVIYTSGTTGKPKGVMIEHRNVISLIAALSKIVYGDIDKYLNVALLAPYIFDASVQQIFPSLLLGHTLFIVNEDVRKDGLRLTKYYQNNKIDVSDGTPAHLSMLREAQGLDNENIEVSYFIIGGDVLPGKVVKEFIEYCREKQPSIINIYGPTECCVDSIAYPVDCNNIDSFSSLPIGKPIANEKIYILDSNLKLSPIGIVGEIYISGAGVGRGYLNQPKLTEDRFIDNVLNDEYKMYKTGDLGKWLPDGNIEFLGRIDHQVKVRGYRIELGEIENQLSSLNEIKEVIVIDKKDSSGEKFLCAYIVAEKQLTVSELREHLLKNLPEYMVPSYFVQLEKMPLTLNGKIDRKALPEPSESAITATEYKAPRNIVEEKLAEIWQQVLKVKKVGIDDNLFQIGGHSLKAIVISAKVSKAFNMEVSVYEMFSFPTIKKLAAHIYNSGIESQSLQDENLVLLKRAQDSIENLFLIHEVSGNVGGYLEFVKQISEDFNCWGIKANKLENCVPKNLKVEELAERYIRKIKKVQKSGPYNIIGWSNGGTIAFEIVRQLEEIKEDIRLFSIVDSYAPDIELIKHAEKFNIDTEKKFLKEAFINTNLVLSMRDDRDIGSLYDLSLDHIKDKNIELNVESVLYKKILSSTPIYDNLSVEQQMYNINLMRTISSACLCYMPKNCIKTQIYYFKATDSTTIDENKWNDYCHFPIKVFKVTGTHFSIFDLQGVTNLAEKFNKLIYKLYSKS